MTDSEVIDDYRWLASPAAEPHLARAAAHEGSTTSLVESLRRELTVERSRLVTQQAELRRRARVKFARADRMLFTPKLLEQATDELLAAAKAARFAERPVADLCCGCGGDALALARGGAVVGVDRDPVALLLARHNAAALDVLIETEQQNVEDFIDRDELPSWAHLDPDRRASGRRVTDWRQCRPGPDCWRRLRDRTRGLAIKLALAAELPDEWSSQAERQWLGSRDECRQQVVWCGELAEHPGRRTAAVVDRAGELRTLVERDSGGVTWAAEPARRLIEPHAAVRAARLAPSLAADGAWRLAAPHGRWLTGDRACDSNLAASFEVVEWAPFDAKRVRKLLDRHGLERIEVKSGGLSLSPEQVLRRLRRRGGREATLVVTPWGPGGGDVVAALCRRG